MEPNNGLSPLEQIKAEQDSERFRRAPLETKIEINRILLDKLKQTSQYWSTDLTTQKQIDKTILSYMPGYDPNEIQGDDAESNRARQILQQAEAIKTGQSNLNAWDGIMEAGRDWLSGKIIAGISDIFIEGDATKALYGDKDQEYEKYRDYLMQVNNPEGAGDYKAGKVIGGILGFGADAAMSMAMYGAVNAPGVLSRIFTGNSAKAFQLALLKSGASKTAALAPIVTKQLVVESVGFAGEQVLADKITGIINEDTEFDDYVKNNFVSNVGKGAAFFAIGESLGKVIAGAAGVARVFSPKGFRKSTLSALRGVDEKTARKGLLHVLANDFATPAEVKAATGADWTAAEIAAIRQNKIDAQLIEEFATGKVDKNKAQEAAFRLFHGMDTEVKGDVVKIKSFNGKALNEPFIAKNNLELQKFFNKNLTKYQNERLDLVRKFSASEKGKLKLAVKTTELKPVEADLTKTVDMFGIGAGANEHSVSTYEELAQNLLKNKKLKVEVLDAVPREFPVKKNTIFVPKVVKTSRQSQQFAKAFFEQVEAHSGGKLKFDTDALESLLRTQSDVAYNEKFLRSITRNTDTTWATDPKTGFIKITKDGVTTEYPNIKQASAALHSAEYTIEELQNILYRRNKTVLEVLDDGKGISVKTRGKEKVFANMEELFNDPKYRPGIPFERRDKFLYLVGDPLKEQKLSKGSIHALVDDVVQYEKDPKFTEDIFQFKSKKIKRTPAFKEYKVVDESTGFSKEFHTIEEAKSWLEKDFDNFTNLRDELYERGWRLQPDKASGYTIVSPGKDTYYAKDLKTVKKIVGNIEDVFNVPEFLDEAEIAAFKQAEPILKQIDAEMKKVFTQSAKKAEKYSGSKASRITQLTRKYLVPIRQRITDSGWLEGSAAFDKASTSYKLYLNQTLKAENYLESVLHGKGRNFSMKQLNDMGSILIAESEPKNWPKIAKELGIEYTASMGNAMRTLRDAMDILGKKFGVEPKDWIDNYWTRLGKLKPDEAQKIILSKGKKEINPYFKRLRTEDYNAARAQTNVEHIFKNYLHLGNRELYLGRTIDEIHELVEKATKDGNVDAKIIKLLDDTSNQLLGNQLSSDKAAEAADALLTRKAKAEAMLAGEGRYAKWSPEKQLRRAQEELSKDYGRFAQDLMTANLMAGKMRLPERNMSQIFTVLNGLTGTQTVTEAMQSLMKDDTAFKLYMEGFEKGIIKPRAGLSYDKGKLMNFIHNANQYGLNNFFNSDDWTRLVAMTAASNTFKKGQAALKSGDLDLKGFLKLIQVDHLNDVDKVKMLDLIGKGRLSSAETLLQRRWSEMTMFEYELIARPEGMHSSLGKVLGQFSTFPLSLLQFVRNGLKAEGAYFAAKLTAGTLATSYFYSNIMGMKDVVHGNPAESMIFLGGPWIGVASNTITSLNHFKMNPSLKGGENLLWNMGKSFVPFGGIASKLDDSIRAFQEGEYYAGVINAFGANFDDESFLFNK